MLREWVLASAIAAGAAALYLPAASYGLILDDRPIVSDNPVVREEDFLAAFTTPWWPVPENVAKPPPNYRPLTTLTFVAQHAMIPDPPEPPVPPPGLPFHLANVLLYAAVVGALAPLARRIAGPGPTAAAALVLFAAHPAHVEAVVPVVGRADLLATLFALLFLEAYLRSRETGRAGLAAASAAFYALSLGSKESGMLLFLLLPAADWLLRGEPLGSLFGRAFLRYLPAVGVLAALQLARAAVLGEATLVVPGLDPGPPLEHVLSVGRNTALSAGLLLAPVASHHIMTTLPTEAPFTYPPPVPSFVSFAVLLLALGILLGWLPLVRKRPVVAFLWFAGVLSWAPTSGVLPIGGGVALRFLFLPSAFAAIGAARLLETAAARAGEAGRTVRAGAVAVLGIAGAIGTLVRVPEWEDDLSLQTAILRQAPGCYRSRAALGAALADQGRREEALAEFDAALRINPKGMEARWNKALALGLARIAARQDPGPGSDLAGSRRLLEEMVRLDPTRPDVLHGLALLDFHEGRLEDCKRRLRECLAQRPPPGLAEVAERMLREIEQQEGRSRG